MMVQGTERANPTPSRSHNIAYFPTLCLPAASLGQGEGQGARAGDEPTERKKYRHDFTTLDSNSLYFGTGNRFLITLEAKQRCTGFH